jgi:small redox-active disulfide protein 2
MVKIQILGTGCPKCKKLAEAAEEAARGMGIAYEIEKVTEIDKILEFGVMSTPGLVIDGKVVLVGKVATPEDIRKLLPREA